MSDGGDLNPELMRYLQRDYWEQKEKTRADSSAEIHHQLPPTTQEAVVMATAGVSGAKSAEELDEFVTTLRTQVEIFVNRMKSNSSRGRSIANDSSVQTLFMNAMSMHSQLLKHIQEQEDKRVYFEGLQDKLTQVGALPTPYLSIGRQLWHKLTATFYSWKLAVAPSYSINSCPFEPPSKRKY